MKKTINLLAITLYLILTGCGDDDATVSTLRVISADTNYTVSGGTGIIEVEAIGEILAESNKSWCQVNVSNNVITVTVAPMKDISGRTALVTITSGTESTAIPVTQTGDAFICDMEDSEFDAEGGSVSFKLETVREYTISGITDDWISCKVDNNILTITAKPAPTGTIRAQDISIMVGNYKLKSTFTQANISGEYQVLYTYKEERYTGSCIIDFTEQKGLYIFQPSEMPINNPFNVMYNNGKLSISFGQYLGVLSGYYLYLCAYDAVGTLSWGENIQYVALPEYDSEGKLTFEFGDNGSWAGRHVDGLYYGAFTGTPSNSTYAGGFATLTDIVLILK